MKLLISALIILIIAASVALVMRSDPGYVLISHGAWKLETTLTLTVIVLVLGFLALYYLIRFIVNAWQLPRRMRAWQDARRLQKARAALTRGLIQLEEGRWRDAEENLIKYATLGEVPLLHYLAAARAAQKQEAYERRDNYLRLAHESTPDADVAVSLTQAELQLSHRQTEQALATLKRLRQLAPKHGYVLKLLMKLHVQMHDWEQLLELLPELRKRKVVSAAEADEMEMRAYKGLLASAARASDVQTLYNIWRRVPKRLRAAPDIVLEFAKQLRAHSEELQCEALLRDTLKKQWNERLVHLYGLVQGPDPAKQLAHAEEWLNEYPKNPVLLLTLGRLAARNRLWGKARAYLEASVGVAPRGETFQELGNLLEQMDEPEAAREYYRKGLLMMLDNV